MDTQQTIDAARAAATMARQAEPVRLAEQATRERMRLEMQTAMTELEAANNKVGNMCVTVAEGASKAVILTSPVEGELKNGEITVQTRKYIVATEDGFKTIEFEVGISYDNALSRNHIESQLKKEERLQAALAGIKDGKIQAERNGYHKTSTGEPYLLVEEILYNTIGMGAHSFSDATGDEVVKAVQNSIAKAQQPHRIGLEAANVNIAAASAVRQAIPK